MQTISGYPTDNRVVSPSVVVRRGGAAVPVTEVSVTRELGSDLPEQVSAASGVVGATGSVRWGDSKAVRTRAAHPWSGDGAVPEPMEPVEVDMGMNGAMVPQLRGFVKRSGGSVRDGKITSQMVDGINRLNRLVTFPAMLATMPPYLDGGAFLHVGNEPTFTTDRVLRACGFNATPAVSTGCVLSVPLMGSAWPEVGTVTSASQRGFLTLTPGLRATHWGVGANSLESNYTPDLSGVTNGRIDKTLQLTFKVDKAPVGTTAGQAYVIAYWGSTDFIKLDVTSTRSIRATALKTGQAETVVLTMPAVTAANSDVFTLRVTPDGTFTIYANGGVNVTGGSWALPASMTGTNMTQIKVNTPHQAKYSIGGVQVNFGPTAVYDSPATAKLTPSTYGWSLPAFPKIDNRNALEVLKEQSAAECSAMWIDEKGVFTWVNREALAGSTPVATLTALKNVIDVTFDSNDAAVRAGVGIKWRQAKIARFPVSSVTLYRGRGETLQPGESTVDIAEPGVDESWFSLDLVGGTHTQYNKGQRSMWGGVITNDAGEVGWAFDYGALPVTLELVAPDKVVITHTATTALAAGETIVLKTPETDPFLKSFREDQPLPIIRGKARARWTDVVTKSAVTGPADAAWLEHDVGPWLQELSEIQELADWLGTQLSQPRAVLSDIPVLPDFRRQLGDVIWLEDPDNMRLRVKVLLTKYTNTVNNGTGKATQTISGRILENPAPVVTNSQLDAHAEEYSNASFDTLWIGGTNTQLDAAPLSRG